MTHETRDFIRRGEASLALDIFRPDPAESHRTAILLFHGGGYRFGDRTAMHDYARHLSARGFTAVAAQYRLLGVAPWPAPLEDARAAIGWIRDRAVALDVEPDRLVLEGFSAGAHLALMAGAAEDGIAAIVAFFPATTLSVRPQAPHESPAAVLLGPEADEVTAAAASPMGNVRTDHPPTFFLHGGADWLVSPATSRAMHDALEVVGASSELHVFAGRHHEFSMEPSLLVPVQDEVVAYLLRTVVASERHLAEALHANPFAAGREVFERRMAARAG